MIRSRSKGEVVTAFRRDAIVSALVRVIAREGFNDVTMHEVAKEAGVSKATLYLYFRDYGEIRRAAEARVQETLLNELDGVLEVGKTPEELLTHITLRALELLDARHDALLAALESPRFARSQFEGKVLELMLRRGVRQIESPASVSFVLNCLRGTLERRLRDSAPAPREEVAALTASMLVYGIRGKSAEN